jgi:phage terminase small subunit
MPRPKTAEARQTKHNSRSTQASKHAGAHAADEVCQLPYPFGNRLYYQYAHGGGNMHRPITVIDSLFCHELIKGASETDALKEARKILGKQPLSSKSANSCAAAIMAKPAVRAYIKKLMKQTHGTDQKICDQAKRVIEELDVLSFSDPNDYWEEIKDDNGNVGLKMKPLKKMGKAARAIESIKITSDKIGEMVTRNRVEVKFHSKTKSLELLGKHHKLYSDLVVHSGSISQGPQIYLPENGKNKPVGE